MKRRSFLSLSALSAIPVTAAAQTEDELSALRSKWWETVTEDALSHKAASSDGSLVLHVELVKPDDSELTTLDRKDGTSFYQYKGRVLPHPRFWPGCTVLTRFELSWDGKPVKIEDRFWNDLAGLVINTSRLDPATVKSAHRWEAENFLKQLRQPRVVISADGGTALIEWERGEECDGSSTIRWIVTRSGTVLRHRDEPPHEC